MFNEMQVNSGSGEGYDVFNWAYNCTILTNSSKSYTTQNGIFYMLNARENTTTFCYVKIKDGAVEDYHIYNGAASYSYTNGTLTLTWNYSAVSASVIALYET